MGTPHDLNHPTPNDLQDLRRALLELNPAQQVAVEALCSGSSQQTAAEAAGVSRETVTRWLGHLPAFKATLNLYRATIASEQVDAARRIRGKALRLVEDALDHGDIDPLAVLRVVTDSSASIGPTEAESLLDAEMTRTRAELPPTPPPRGLAEQLDQLDNPPPSQIERAEVLTLTRLAQASNVSPRHDP